MRTRQEIETDGKRVDLLTLELLLDIRDLLNKEKKIWKPRGRPRKNK